MPLRLLIFASTVCLIVAWLCVQAPVLHWDAVQYMSLGEHLSLGKGYQSSLMHFPDLMQPPLYPLLIAALTPFFGALRAATVICLCAMTATLWLLARLHLLVFGPRGLVLTILIAAIYPNLADGGALLLEPLFFLLLCAAVTLAVQAARDGSVAAAAGSGACLGLALMTRPEVVLTAPVAAALVLSSGQGAWRRLSQLCALCAGAAALVVPYGLWMRSHLGEFEVLPKLRYNVPMADITSHMDWEPGEEALVDRQQRVWFTLMPDRREFVMAHAFAHGDFDPRAAFPRRARPAQVGLRTRLLHLRRVIKDAVGTGMFHPLALLLLAVAAVPALRRSIADPKARPQAALCALCVLHTAPAVAAGSDYNGRYLGASLLFSVPLVAAGAAAASEAIQRRWQGLPRHLPAVVLAALLLSGYALGTARIYRGHGGGPEGRRREAALAAACARHLSEGSRVLGDHLRYEHVRAGRAYNLPHARSMDELLDFIRNHRIDYAVFDARALKDYPSRICRSLADPRTWPPGFVAVEHLFSDGDPIWLVRVRRP